MTVLSIQDLSVEFDDVVAVNKLSLHVASGELVVFLGPSGCGKTTLLRCVAGLQQPTGGQILFDDEDVTNLSPADRNVAMVFQFVSLYPHLSVADNIAFPLRARGVSKSEIKASLDWAAQFFKLGDLMRRRPNRLPPGDKQKVALARAVVRKPSLLLLDEPLSALDEQFREDMRWELGKLQAELGITTVYVTHDQREAMSLADRIVLMRDGKLIQNAGPAEMYAHPVDRFAAYFIGSPPMNFLSVHRSGGSSPWLVDAEAADRPGEGTAVPLAASPGLAARLNKIGRDRFTLGVRPQHLGIDGDGGSRIQVQVVNAFTVGHDHQFDFSVGGTLYSGMPAALPQIGARIDAVMTDDHVHLFDADTGDRFDV
ncbi:MAG: ABC transporter ATP-binding protein [Rhodospirillaceae bacterium]|nr:ABC transporter ATP-binding protein [Rhodospirillaceae bacterium]MCA8933750.1 ABC transporter ATP-binding protein [Rhodospirillaceae bacterium]